jgi:hypothetical protein
LISPVGLSMASKAACAAGTCSNCTRSVIPETSLIPTQTRSPTFSKSRGDFFPVHAKSAGVNIA